VLIAQAAFVALSNEGDNAWLKFSMQNGATVRRATR
jgi:hypothetical protein